MLMLSRTCIVLSLVMLISGSITAQDKKAAKILDKVTASYDKANILRKNQSPTLRW